MGGYQRNTCSCHFRINCSKCRRQFIVQFAEKRKPNALPRTTPSHEQPQSNPSMTGKRGPPLRWPYSIKITSYTTGGFASDHQGGISISQPLSLQGRGLFWSLTSLGSACFHAIARKIPEMLQVIQQDAFISDLTKWVKAYTELWKDLAGFNSKFRKEKKWT